MIPILRQIYNLRADDLRAHPVWTRVYGVDAEEPWYDEAEHDIDEVTYRPWPESLPYVCTLPSRRTCLVAGRFALADGTPLDGFFRPPAIWEADKGTALSYLQPRVFVADSSYRSFWSGGERQHRDTRAEFYAAIEKPASAVFPVRFRALPGLLNVDFEGTIEGFAYMANDNRTVVVETR